MMVDATPGKYFGPFPVVAVHSPIAIEVRLPAWLHANLHPVFHSMYLKPAEKRTTDANLRRQIGNVFEPAHYGVERILAHRERADQREYLVQWENCSYLQSTWEPVDGLVSAQHKLTQYHARRRQVEM